MDGSVMYVYAAMAAVFWGGLLTLGFRALGTWREDRQLARAANVDLDGRLTRLEADVSAIRRALETAGAPAALPSGARVGERPAERPMEAGVGLRAEPPSEHRR
jgi:hypothetical protein